MSEIKPIQTRYKGYNFRSRLEARYAVFFDALDIDWEYESEGYDLGELGWYLPDFYLPQVSRFVEVKRAGGFDNLAIGKCVALALLLKCKVLLCEGTPGDRYFFNTVDYNKYNDVGGVWFGQVELCNGHHYHKTEHRFYSNPGWWPTHDYGYCDEEYKDFMKAAYVARSARFEHGQNGAT